MDKSWINSRRDSLEYDVGVQQFMEFANKNAEKKDIIRCPCVKCRNLTVRPPRSVSEHLFKNGFDNAYTNWFWHGEAIEKRKGVDNQSGGQTIDIDETNDFNDVNTVEMVYQNCTNEKAFEDLLDDAKKPLYPGCQEFTKLSALVRLFNIKGKFGWSDISFTELLKLLSELLPKGNELPLSTYAAKKTMSTLGIEYQKIHACPNNCILYRNQYKNLYKCPTCSVSRWKRKEGSEGKEGSEDDYRKGVPAKVMWYFPIIPRFKRMFQSPDTAKNLIWHETGRVDDGKLRHPADSESWKLIDQKWPDFASDPRNLRLALSADGINPHSSLSSTYSCWPVLLVTYNLPPWLCMKRKFVMLSVLISGPQQPGNDIDVYLEPLVEDLQYLWDVGVEMFDAHRKESFNLRAVLMWTINDFPAYGNLAGCTVKGYNACPYCGVDTPKCRLKHSRKNCYIGHRRWLPKGHAYRYQSKSFNNSIEERTAPKTLTGEEILKLVNSFENTDVTKGKKRKRGAKEKTKEVNDEDKGRENDDRVWFKRKSIFFKLKYWKHLLIRHQLDVMHIEKNICESIYGTLLNIPGKSKDGIKSRLDLVHMKMRRQLAPQDKDNNRTYLPPACYNLTSKEKKIFCSALKGVKVPRGYSSNIRSLVSKKELKLQGLKSHDCHVLLQQLMPIVLRAVLPKHVRKAIIRLCVFFNSLCATVVDVGSLDQLENEMVITLCMLEKCFPPSFFDIMVHLTVHLVYEVRKCGPVYLRWMYPFERFMKFLKGYVRNRNFPEGCIAESYIAEEALEICSNYMPNMKTVGVPDGYVQKLSDEKHKGKMEIFQADQTSLQQAHFYILEHMEEIDQFAIEHMDNLRARFKGRNEVWLKKEHRRCFPNWLKEKVYELVLRGEHVSENLRWLSNGPTAQVRRYSAYDISGYHFETHNRGSSRSTQNSAVTCVASTMQVSSVKDSNPITSDMSFYGVIDDIWEIDYKSFTIPVFKCNWVNNAGGVRVDEYGLTLVDLKRLGHKTDPFILASQAKQIFYITDPVNNKWSVVCHMPSRGTPTNCDDDELEAVIDQPPLKLKLPEVEDLMNEVVEEDSPIFTRDGEEGIWVFR